MKPLFIAFEGIDGAGTTTQCELLCARLRLEGHDVVQTREPGGTEACERIRDLVLDPALKSLDAVTELFLMGASRRQHVAELIEPSLRSGKPVISDRYAQSSMAYQGIGRGLGVDLVGRINEIATGGLTADLTIFFDLNVNTALHRRRARTGEDRLELEGVEFQAAVRQAFINLAGEAPTQSLLVDADKPIEDLAQHVYRALLVRFPQFPFRKTDP